MKQRARYLMGIVAIVLVLCSATSSRAQMGGGYDLTWSTIDGGSATSSNGGYTLLGTAGQPDAGVLSGGGYMLNSGFWGGVGALHRVYLPIVLR